jgi:cyclomaltodextrinase / maltogenic alpha-amylase / neopullulanase
MTVPYWVQDAVFYQIFPDRFANGDLTNDPPNVQPWGSPPNLHGFQGGDLRGIIQQFDYLLDLGVTALYLNPIFLSPSSHRYNTVDYYRIDPKLGDLNDFHSLLRVAHANNVRVILDGVFNHSGRGFFAFSDILENQEHSPYRDWFHIRHLPVDAYGAGRAESFLGWWGHKSLPKFNTNNLQVRRYIMNVARYWIEQGADGWRLDVPNEIDDDSFWAEFRQVVKTANRDAYLVGEIWTADPRWVGQNHFDGLMHYPIRDAMLDFVETGFLSATAFAEKVEGLLELYPRPNVHSMYVTLGSHDTERLRTKLGGSLAKVRLAFSFLFAYPGAPAVYYGDEIGLSGGKDPECRGAFPWNADVWVSELRASVQSMIALRKNWSALRRGSYKRVFVDDRRSCYAFARILGSEKVLVAMNASPTQRYLRLPVAGLGWADGRILRNLLGREEFLVSGDTLAITLPPWGSVWAA